MKFKDRIKHKIAEATEMYIIKIQYNPRARFDALRIVCPWTNDDKGIKTIELFMSAFAIAKPKIKNKVTYKICVDDFQSSDKKIMVYSKSDESQKLIAIPDFIFLNWKEDGILDYDKWCYEMVEASHLEPKYEKAFWIGNVATHPTRRVLCELAMSDDRLEVYGMNWARDYVETGKNTPTKFVSLIDHVQYKYLIDIQGRGYSGRLKMLLFSGRPIFVADRKYKEYYHNDLIPWEHYIPVKEDLSDLIEKLDWADANPDACVRIAENAQKFALEHLTRKNAIDYFAETLIKLAN